MGNGIKQPKTELGSLEMRLLAYVQMRKMDVVRTKEIAAALKITPKQERELFSRMSRSGVFIRLTRGVYLVGGVGYVQISYKDWLLLRSMIPEEWG